MGTPPLLSFSGIFCLVPFPERVGISLTHGSSLPMCRQEVETPVSMVLRFVYLSVFGSVVGLLCRRLVHLAHGIRNNCHSPFRFVRGDYEMKTNK